MRTWIEQLSPHTAIGIDDAISDRELVRTAVAEIGEAACAWAIESARAIISDIEKEFAVHVSSGTMTGHEGEAVESGLLTTLMAFHGETPASKVVRPRGAAENVRMSAREGVPVATLLRTVWSCHTRFHDALLRELESLVAPNEIMTELRALNAALYAYVDLYVTELTTEYQNELVAWSGHIPAERLHAMRSILDGEAPSAAIERTLGLRLTDHHIVAMGWQGSGRHVTDRQAELTRFGTRVGRVLGAASTLTLHHDGVADFWWTLSSAPQGDLTAIVAEASPPPWARIALGEVGLGLPGFRNSYFTAQQAAKVSRRSPHSPVVSYRDVRLIALLGADELAARRFVAEELAGLDGGEDKIADLRKTLRHFLRSGNSRIAAARELNLAPNTVAYRVARAGELLGRPATQRPTETLLALELVHYFPDYLAAPEPPVDESRQPG